MTDERASDPPRERTGCAFGMALALLAALGLALQVGVGGVERVSSDEVLAEAFADRAAELPFGLVVGSAGALPGGARVVRLAHPDFAGGFPDLPKPEPSSEAKSEAQSADGEGALPAGPRDVELDAAANGEDVHGKEAGGEEAGGEADDGEEAGAESDSAEAVAESPGAEAQAPAPRAPRRPPPLAVDQPPVEVLVTVYSDPGSVNALFREPRMGMGGGGGGMGGGDMGGGSHWRIAAGELDWRASTSRGPGTGAALIAPYVLERAVTPAGMRDSLRVNLSSGTRYVVLSAQWPRGALGSTKRVEELLSFFALHPPKEAAPAPDAGS